MEWLFIIIPVAIILAVVAGVVIKRWKSVADGPTMPWPIANNDDTGNGILETDEEEKKRLEQTLLPHEMANLSPIYDRRGPIAI